MEHDLGLSALSDAEKSVLYAVELLADDNNVAPLSRVRCHSLVAGLSRPTFFRALKRLVDDGILEASYGKNASFYRIAKKYP